MNYNNNNVADAVAKLEAYMNGIVPNGSPVAEVFMTAQRVNTAIQILAGNLGVIESNITLEYVKAEKGK